MRFLLAPQDHRPHHGVMSAKTPKPITASGSPAEAEGPGFVMSRGYTLEEGLASVGAGWADLVRAVFADLPAGVVIDQVKEKYGQMRVYHEPYRPRFQAVIDAAETQSATICEQCGAPGTFDRSFHWIRVLCPTHIAERAANRPRRVVETIALVNELVRQSKLPPEQRD